MEGNELQIGICESIRGETLVVFAKMILVEFELIVLLSTLLLNRQKNFNINLFALQEENSKTGNIYIYIIFQANNRYIG